MILWKRALGKIQMSSIIWHLKLERKSPLISFYLHFPSSLWLAFPLLSQGSLPCRVGGGGRGDATVAGGSLLTLPLPGSTQVLATQSHLLTQTSLQTLFSECRQAGCFHECQNPNYKVSSYLPTVDDELKFPYMLSLCVFYLKEPKTGGTSVSSQVKDDTFPEGFFPPFCPK